MKKTLPQIRKRTAHGYKQPREPRRSPHSSKNISKAWP